MAFDISTTRNTWTTTLAALVALVLPLALLACTDTDDFESSDTGATDAAAEGAPWPDMSPLPDGYFSGAGNKMYAHSQSQLFSLDPSTLKLELVGTFAVVKSAPDAGPDAPNINDLAMTPKGQLYAVSTRDLYEVDHKTAQIKHVITFQGANDNVALTFEASGTLLASDQTGVLRRIDPVTGAVTEIGSYGPNLGESGDLVAIKDGTLFGVNDVNAQQDNQLMTIDPKTGKATVIGPIGYPRVWGLAYWGGTVYGLCKTGELLKIDPKTGVGTLVSTFSHEFWGAAVTPIAPLQ